MSSKCITASGTRSILENEKKLSMISSLVSTKQNEYSIDTNLQIKVKE